MNKINLILELFAKTNEVNSYGVSYLYKFSKISTCDKDKIEYVVTEHMKSVIYCSNSRISVGLKKLDNWEEQLFKENDLFRYNNPQFKSSEDLWLGIVPQGIDLNGFTPKNFLIAQLKEYFNSDNVDVFSMNVDTDGYYSCSWEDYLFYNKTRYDLYWLSFQMHD